MKIWKQVLLSLAVLAAALVLWFEFFPGAGAVLGKLGLGGPAAQLQHVLGIGGAETRQAAAGPQGPAASGSGGGAGAAPASGGGRAGGAGASRGRGGFFGGPTLVVVRPATSAVLNDKVAALGTGVALQSAALAPQASGTLTELDIHSGDHVTAGTVVARLDSDSQQIAYDKARLAVADAEQTLAHDQQLVKSGTMPSSQLQSAQLAANVAQLTLRSARHDLDARQVVAPFDGVVGLVTLNPGVPVTTQTTIATLEDISKLVIRFSLPERLIGAVKQGQQAEVVPVARPDLIYSATVTAVDTQVDSASGTFQVEARLPNPDGNLVSGMTFGVAMRFAGNQYVAVDPLAIQWGSDGAYVWRLKPDDTVEKVAVRIVQRNTDAVLVAGELSEGDLIVTEGLEGLRPGGKVQVAGAAPAGPGGLGGQAQTATRGGGAGGQAQAGQGGQTGGGGKATAGPGQSGATGQVADGQPLPGQESGQPDTATGGHAASTN